MSRIKEIESTLELELDDDKWLTYNYGSKRNWKVRIWITEVNLCNWYYNERIKASIQNLFVEGHDMHDFIEELAKNEQISAIHVIEQSTGKGVVVYTTDFCDCKKESTQ